MTVVVPCYNYGHYLPGALTSALRQPGVDVDVIAIDDCSPDGSAEVLRSLAAAEPRIRPIFHDRNRGHIATYNEGLEQAAGEFVVLLSADDVLPAGSLSRATALMVAEPTVGFTYGFPATFDGSPPPTRTAVRSWTVWDGSEWVARLCRRGSNCVANPEVVMRTSVQQEIGAYDPSLPHSGDMEMWLRAASVADVGRVNGATQGFYRVHDSSMQRTTFAGHLNDLEGRLEAFRSVLVGDRARIQDGPALFDVARRSLARSAITCARVALDNRRSNIEPVQGYIDFALAVWPEAARWRRLRTVQRRWSEDARSAKGDPLRGVRLMADDLVSKARWQRWRWSGA